jgi:hypothetical protein
VEVDGTEREMEFLTNNPHWSATSVTDLYRCRWQIEVFFKQIKQSLQLCDFLGNSANAVRWQVWTALLLYVLMRFLSAISSWNHSFTRLFTLLRAALWSKIDLWDLLRFCGTAGLAIAVGALREGAVHSHTRRALEAGCTPDELRHVGVLAITTIGFPSTMAAMSWVEDILRT